jgi:hypothetical protein
MTLFNDMAADSIRARRSLRHHVGVELDAHPGWWIPSIAICLIWAALPKRKARP